MTTSQLTSFGFHQDLVDRDEPDSTFSTLFSRVKSAFASSSDNAAAETAGNLARGPSRTFPNEGHHQDSITGASGVAVVGSAEGVTTARSAVEGPTGSSLGAGGMSDNREHTPQVKASSSNRDSARRKAPRSGLGKGPSLPHRSGAAAPSIATAAAHAMAHNGILFPTGGMDDMSSVGADDGEDVSMEGVANLRRSSTVAALGGQKPQHDWFKAQNASISPADGLLSNDRSTIPGFPLSHDILADDTRSIHSSSSRFRLDTVDEPSYASPSAAQAGLQTSADAIYRRMRGLSMSKQFWMADESAKECRECLSTFTPFRRKHHCRVCGQIFCSRCASNIIPGTRMGHEGVIRVCNFCTRMLSEYEREERTKLASKNNIASQRSGATSRPTTRLVATGRVLPGMISGPLEAQTRNPLSEFTANHLFPRTAFTAYGTPSLVGDPSHMTTIDSDFQDSRPSSPMPPKRVNALLNSMEKKEEPAPFRKGLGEEDVDQEADVDEEITSALDIMSGPVTPSPSASQTDNRIDFPTSGGQPPSTKALGSIAVRKSADPRARLVSDAAFRAFRHSRLRSRVGGFNDVLTGTNGTLKGAHTEGMPSFRESTFGLPALPAPATTLVPGSFDLSPPSLTHLRRMLEQTLMRADVGPASMWLEILIPLVVRAVVTVRPNPRIGEGMDIRHYVKVKRIPGGTPHDSHYVDGFVLSKHVATKKMARMLPLSHARVLIVTFALDYHRDATQYVSLEPLIAQEHEYIRILVARLTALRPHIIVAGKTVSRLALEMLENAGVVVVHNVKQSAIEAIARCTQADVVPSLDRLALEPRLGRCSRFAVETYEHAIEIGRRKSFMRFSGLSREVGCTLVVRGGDVDLLHRIKAIAILMVFVGYNLRLEEHLMRDEGAQLLMPELPKPAKCKPGFLPSVDLEVLIDNDGVVDVEYVHQQVLKCLSPYEETILSASASVSLPPPYPLMRLKEAGAQIIALKHQNEAEETARILREEAQAATLTPTPAAVPESSTDYSFLPSVAKSVDTVVQTDEQTEVIEKELSDQASQPTQDLTSVLRSPEDIAKEGRYALAEAQYLQDAKNWTSYAVQSQDAVSVTPFSHQQLVVVAATVCNATQRPCIGPSLHQVEYYGFGDETVGHFLEHLCNEAMNICPVKGCDRQNVMHFQSYVHNETRLQVMSEQYVCPIAGEDQRLLMWSYCKLCEKPTPITVTSEETWSLSFAKYLELHFYPSRTVTANQCGHDFFRDHIRFFAFKNIVVRFHADSIEAREIVVPSFKLRVIPAIQAKLKNSEALSLSAKSHAYWDSVSCRIKAIGREAEQDRDIARRDTVRAKLRDMINKCESDRREVDDHLIRLYKETSPLNVLCFNVARRAVQDKVVQWDYDFAELEKSLPSEKDIRRLTTSHLKRIFAERDSIDRTSEQLSLPPAVEVDEAVVEGTSDNDRVNTEVLTAEALQAVADVASTSFVNESAPKQSPVHADTVISSSPEKVDVAQHFVPATNSVSPGGCTSTRSSPPESQGPLSKMSPTSPGRHGTSVAAASRYRAGAWSRPDDSSCTENELSSKPSKAPGFFSHSETRHLASGAESGSDAASLASTALTRQSSRGARPSLRKVKTDDTIVHREHSRVSNHKRPASGTSTPLVLTSRASSPTRKGSEHSKLPVRQQPTARNRSSSIHRVDHNAGPSRRINGAAPPTSFRPLKGLDNSKRPAPSVSTAKGLPPLASDPSGRHSSSRSVTRNECQLTRGTARKSSFGSSANRGTPAQTKIAAGTKTRVSTIARHFDRINREAEREREHQRNLLAIRARRARPVGMTQATVEVFSSVREATKDDESDLDSDSESGSAADDEEGNTDSDSDRLHLRTPSVSKHSAAYINAEPSMQKRPDESVMIGNDSAPSRGVGDTISTGDLALKGDVVSDAGSTAVPTMAQVATLPSYLRSGLSSDTEGSVGTERKSLMNTLSGFWAFRSSESLPLLEYPLLSTEHVFSDSKIILREDEPTSIIAFTLSSKNYADRLRSVQATRTRVNVRDESVAGDISNTLEDWDVIDLHDGADIEASLRRPEGTHVRFEFASENTRFYCKIYWAEQFDALRRKCACDDSIIESLARCVKWNSTGGKSGAFFIKTRDDRLVVKQLSKYEADAFSTFAPSYFQYLAQCLYGQRPTTLAKIFGCFRIGYRNPQTGKHFRIDCLVTENLFYGREMSKIYDLKGSTRNRHMQETGRANEVLLDENLIEQAYQSPLFVREHSKRLLRAALFNDSLFLSEMNVMDYSLVVGVDKTSRELVVGIIDFVRTYTWDKRVENFVKETALLGGGGKGEPTIITPRMYRGRFLSFMNRCFVLTPDAWLPDAWKIRETSFTLPTIANAAT